MVVLVLTHGFPHAIFLKLCVDKDLYFNIIFSEFERIYRILGFCNFPETIWITRFYLFLSNQKPLLSLLTRLLTPG